MLFVSDVSAFLAFIIMDGSESLGMLKVRKQDIERKKLSAETRDRDTQRFKKVPLSTAAR